MAANRPRIIGLTAGIICATTVAIVRRQRQRRQLLLLQTLL